MSSGIVSVEVRGEETHVTCDMCLSAFQQSLLPGRLLFCVCVWERVRACVRSVRSWQVFFNLHLFFDYLFFSPDFLFSFVLFCVLLLSCSLTVCSSLMYFSCSSFLCYFTFLCFSLFVIRIFLQSFSFFLCLSHSLLLSLSRMWDLSWSMRCRCVVGFCLYTTWCNAS